MGNVVNIQGFLRICINCKWYSNDGDGVCKRPGGYEIEYVDGRCRRCASFLPRPTMAKAEQQEVKQDGMLKRS